MFTAASNCRLPTKYRSLGLEAASARPRGSLRFGRLSHHRLLIPLCTKAERLTYGGTFNLLEGLFHLFRQQPGRLRKSRARFPAAHYLRAHRRGLFDRAGGGGNGGQKARHPVSVLEREVSGFPTWRRTPKKWSRISRLARNRSGVWWFGVDRCYFDFGLPLE